MAFRFSHWRRLPDSLPLFWRLQIVGWTGYALDRLLQAPGDFVPVPLTYIAVAFGLSLCLRLLYRRLWRRSPPLWQIGATAVGGSIVAAYLWLAISQYSFWMRGIWPWPKIGHSTILLVTLEETLTHHKPFLFLSWSALYFGIKYWQREQEQQSRALRAGVLAKEAELALLRYQLNPHFLFNSLNSVSALVREDPDGAERMLNELSEFLRLALSRAAAGEAPLRDELDAARKYLAIEKIRFEDKLVVAFEIETHQPVRLRRSRQLGATGLGQREKKIEVTRARARLIAGGDQLLRRTITELLEKIGLVRKCNGRHAPASASESLFPAASAQQRLKPKPVGFAFYEKPYPQPIPSNSPAACSSPSVPPTCDSNIFLKVARFEGRYQRARAPSLAWTATQSRSKQLSNCGLWVVTNT